MFDHRIENCQKLSHTSDQSDLWGFASITQPFVESSDQSITSAGNQSSHVKNCPYTSSAAPDGTTAAQGTAVAIEWCNADQSSDLFTVELSEFWQLGQQRTANDGTDTRDSSQQVFVLLPDGTLTNGLIQIVVSSAQFRFQPADMSIDAFSDAFGSCTEPVSLCHNHVGDLSPASNESAQFHGDLIRQRAQCRAYGFTEAGQHQSIDAISFGQLAGGFGEISDLPRVNDHHRELSTGQSTSQWAFDSASGFQHDQCGLEFFPTLDQSLDCDFVVSNRLALTRGTHCDIESCFGHVDTDKKRGNFQNSILLDLSFLQHSSTLQMMRAWITQATVRAFREAGRDDPGSRTICSDQGVIDLSRPVSY